MANTQVALESSSPPPETLAPGRPALPEAAAIPEWYAPQPRSAGGNQGQPVDTLPPLIEPTQFAEEPSAAPGAATGQRPARRGFLAPASPISVGARAEPPGAPLLIEPVAQAPLETGREVRSAGWQRAWLAAVQPLLTISPRLAAIVGLAVAVALVLGLAFVSGMGLFGHSPRSVVRADAPSPSDPAQRLSYYQHWAKAGDPEAQLQLAIIYAKGDGVAQDYPSAATWFEAAAAQGVPRAQYDLGVLYERGRGVPVNFIEAANWYRKAADGNYPLAQYNLAVSYTKGQGVRQDPSEAALWYRRAAAQGVGQAMINLAALYERGEGVPASPVDAYAWYFAAGRRGNEGAARRAKDLFAALPRLDQIRAEAMAGDVAGSIHDAEPERNTSGPPTPAASSAGGPSRP